MLRVQPQEFGIGLLYEEIHDAIVVAEVETERIVLWNAHAEAMLGYTEDEAIGMPLEMLVPPRLRASHRAGLARYRATGHGPVVDANQSVRLPALHREGREVSVELSLSPLDRDGGGTGSFVLAIVRDVSEAVRLEGELRETNASLQMLLEEERRSTEQLRQLLELRREFLDMLAHDLRSPLTSIRGAADMLLNQSDRVDDTLRQELLSMVVRSAGRMALLMEDVLAAAKLDAGTLSYESAPFDLGSAAAAALKELAAVYGHDRFTLAIPPDLPMVLGDEHRHAQVIINLLSNAAKFSPTDTTVEVCLKVEDGAVRLSVTDHGSGIPAEFQDRLFKKFSRLPRAKGKAEGTGLGLYISRRLVEDQGGELVCTSVPGRTTFSYTALRASSI